MKFFGYEFRKASDQKSTVDECCCGGEGALLFGKLLGNNAAAMSLSAVFRCTNLISEQLALMPIRVMRIQSKSCKEEDTNHSLNIVFKSGIANNISRFQFIKLLIQSVLLKGNGFALIERAVDGTVLGLRFIEPGDVNIHFDKAKKEKSLYYTTTITPQKRIEPCNMIHLRMYSLDGINGKSVLSYADRTLKLSQNGEVQASNVLSNGCNLSGVLKVDGTLTKQQREQIHKTWNESMYNGGNGLAVLAGNMSYQPIQISPEDAQLLQSRLFQVDEICRFFGVSPILVGELSHTQYGSLESAQQEFLLHTLSSYIEMVEEEFNAKLFKPSERDKYIIKFNESAILKTDKTAIANYYATLLKNGVLCIDEVRKELGYNEIGATDHYLPYTDTSKSMVGTSDNNIDKDKDNGETV